ncbi:MAG: CDP-alcohol phosphatidyltransferase family protein [Deltaproteobacteria bacterium]|nr:CDP-alcohol phosphatidyltransferase family protein [Deltaproteobacteria bacterium]
MFARIADAYRRTRKTNDLLWNRFVARPLAAVFLVPLERTSITPNQVTLATLLVFAIASGTIAFVPTWTGLLIGVAILQFAYVLDCVDGQLARLRGTSTPIGAHLDFLMDELKAFLLVASVGIRLWRSDGQQRWLLEALTALVAVASAISLTTFLRRPEYAAATGATVDQGRGDYGDGFAAKAPAGRLSPKRIIEAAGSLIVHYPSYIVFVALADRIDIFLHAYLIVNAAHVGRSLLAIAWKLGRKTV